MIKIDEELKKVQARTKQEELIEELQKDEGVMQFALPDHGRGYVTQSGELLLSNSDTIRSYGQFEKSIDDKYYFVYQPVSQLTPVARLIPEELHSIDEELAKDLYAFAVKLGYFFAKHNYYASTRDHDLDVFAQTQYGELSTTHAHKNYRQLHTPLAKAGFRVEPHSTC